MTDKDIHDGKEIRCPRLGHELTFAYCRREAGDLPCPRILRCWADFFPVEKFLKDVMGPHAWDAFLRQAPPDKLTNILDLIEKAKARRLDDPAATSRNEKG